MEENRRLTVTVLGARGSVPVDGPEFREFGGATSCYLVASRNARLVLDAGTGILGARLPQGPAALLLSHAHADHLVGLPFFPAMMEPGRAVDIFLQPRGGLSARAQLDRFFSSPLWPATLDDYPARVSCRDLSLPLALGDLRVEGMESNHPNGSTVFRIASGGRSLVYASDFEHSPEASAALADFARGADLILYDGQYSPEEYQGRRGFGHSTPEQGLELLRASGARRLLIVHHDPRHGDGTLAAMEREIRREAGPDRACFAREGDVIAL